MKKICGGFTVIEILVSLSVLFVLSVVIVWGFVQMERNSNLDAVSQEIISCIRRAQNKSLSAEENVRYGVYFDNSAFPNSYTLFKGNSYAERDTDEDEVFLLPDDTELYDINLTGGDEIVFNRIIGNTDQPGSLSVRKVTDASGKTIFVNESGITYLTEQTAGGPSSEDYRHVHANYQRYITAEVESVIIEVNDSIEQSVPISTNMIGGNFDWEGTISGQEIGIHTHRMNDPDTQFCIHRDGRYSNLPLTVRLSGDGTGNIAEYSADLHTAGYTSIYVTEFEKQ